MCFSFNFNDRQGLSPDQCVVRNLLILNDIMTPEHATEYARSLSLDFALICAEVLQNAVHPAQAFIVFHADCLGDPDNENSLIELSDIYSVLSLVSAKKAST